MNICILPDLRQVSVPSFQLIAQTEFILCDLENQGCSPKMNRIPQGPMGKLYTRFQGDIGKKKLFITQKLCLQTRWTDRWILWWAYKRWAYHCENTVHHCALLQSVCPNYHRKTKSAVPTNLHPVENQDFSCTFLFCATVVVRYENNTWLCSCLGQYWEHSIAARTSSIVPICSTYPNRSPCYNFPMNIIATYMCNKCLPIHYWNERHNT